jgi:phosphoserine phosphatase RsbX
MEAVRTGPIEWAVAEFVRPGQTESGDQYLVMEIADGVVVGVIDGLGHGAEAANASKTAIRSIERHAGEPAIKLMQECHQSLIGLRGAVMSVASINAVEESMTWLGVGNVEGLLLRAHPAAIPSRELLLLRGGVVGVHLPALTGAIVPLAPGDTLIFATDGVRSEFLDETRAHREAPAVLADRILGRYGRGTDDALVMVVRYLGLEP